MFVYFKTREHILRIKVEVFTEIFSYIVILIYDISIQILTSITQSKTLITLHRI